MMTATANRTPLRLARVGTERIWVAEISGLSATQGFERDFLRPVDVTDERALYILADGLYESQQGPSLLDRRYWRVENDEAFEITRSELVDAL